MPALATDHFYSDGELREFLHSWATARPQLVEIESIGESWEGRDIWLVTLTNRDTGPALEKPGFLVEAGIHSNEWTGGFAALHLVDRLARDYGTDERVTRLLDTRCVNVVPRLNPDGVEHALAEGRYIRSSVRRDRVEQPPGLRAGDVDGDGRHLFMRVRDPDGPFKPHPDEPRLLVPREPDEEGGEYYRLLPEGVIEGFDGVTITVAPPVERLDLGGNFPGDLSSEVDDGRAGPFPGSEPEVAAYLRAVAARPNITGYVTCHTFGGLVLTPPHNADDEVPDADRQVYRALGAKAAALTGYRVMSYLDLKVDKSDVVRGSQSQWFYDHLGVHAWITEFWNPLAAAGIELGSTPVSSWLYGHHPVEDDLRLIAWSDDELGGRGFVTWYPFEHPQLGPVELGGWDKINFWYNAPPERLEAEVAPHTEWVILLALAGPLLRLRMVESEPLAETTYRLRAVVQNAGWLPTHVTQRALDRQVVGPVTVELDLPDGARLISGERVTEAGQLAGRADQQGSSTWWSYRPSTEDLRVVEWIVGAPPGSKIGVTARHPRAGTDRGSLVL